MSVPCQQSFVLAGSATLASMGVLSLCFGEPSSYGKHSLNLAPETIRLPAGIAWFLQELPSFLVPAGFLFWHPLSFFGTSEMVLLCLFCVHYTHRVWQFASQTWNTFHFVVDCLWCRSMENLKVRTQVVSKVSVLNPGTSNDTQSNREALKFKNL